MLNPTPDRNRTLFVNGIPTSLSNEEVAEVVVHRINNAIEIAEASGIKIEIPQVYYNFCKNMITGWK